MQKESKTTLKRRAAILDIVNKDGKVTVPDLSDKYGVSVVTIRNDLMQLEKKKLLIRTHGGAIKEKRVGFDFAVSEKAEMHPEEKLRIANKALEFIENGDTIILDSGSTTQQIARQLQKFKDLTVVTNALNIVATLADFSEIEVIIPGGILRKRSLSLIGSIAENGIKNVYADKLFLGVDGIDSDFGITTPNMEEAYLNRLMIERSKEIFVVTDSSKFEKRSMAYITGLENIDTLITDVNIPEKQKRLCENKKVKVITV